MLVPHYMLLMLFYDGAASAPNIKTQEGKELVVEWHCDAHVFDSYLYVVNDRFHLSSPPFKAIFYTTHQRGSLISSGAPVGPFRPATTGSQKGVNRPSGPNTRGKVKIAGDLPRITLPRFDSSCPAIIMECEIQPRRVSAWQPRMSSNSN